LMASRSSMVRMGSSMGLGADFNIGFVSKHCRLETTPPLFNCRLGVKYVERCELNVIKSNGLLCRA
jgi:hypothetical protein